MLRIEVKDMHKVEVNKMYRIVVVVNNKEVRVVKLCSLKVVNRGSSSMYRVKYTKVNSSRGVVAKTNNTINKGSNIHRFNLQHIPIPIPRLRHKCSSKKPASRRRSSHSTLG